MTGGLSACEHGRMLKESKPIIVGPKWLELNENFMPTRLLTSSWCTWDRLFSLTLIIFISRRKVFNSLPPSIPCREPRSIPSINVCKVYLTLSTDCVDSPHRKFLEAHRSRSLVWRVSIASPFGGSAPFLPLTRSNASSSIFPLPSLLEAMVVASK